MSNKTNNVNTTLTPWQVAKIKDAMHAIYSNMPFLLAPAEAELGFTKMNAGDKTYSEDMMIMGYNGIHIPSHLTTQLLERDISLNTRLSDLEALVKELIEKIEEAQMTAGSEAFISALSRLFATASETGVPCADAITDELKKRSETQAAILT